MFINLLTKKHFIMKKNLLFIALFFISIGLNAQYWSQQNTNMTGTRSGIAIGVDQISIVDSSIVWINGYNGSGQGRFIHANSRTQDGGATWHAGSYSGFGTNVQATVLCGVSYNKAFCVAYDTASSVASFWKTTDGTNWSTVTGVLNNGSTTFADGVKFWGNGKGFCYGDPVSSYFNIYTTSDSGKTWNAVPTSNIPIAASSTEYGLNGFDCVSIVPGGFACFLTTAGRVITSNDYGATWTATPTAPFTTAAGGSLWASSPTYIIISNLATTTSTSYTYKFTTDGGTTWNDFNPTSGTFYQSAMCYVPGTDSMFVATGGNSSAAMGVGYTTDGGMAWTDFTDSTYLQPGGSNIQCLGVGFYNANIGWVGNYDQAQSINSILKYHPAPVGMDGGVITVLQPVGQTGAGSMVQVQVRVKNFGTDTINSMNIAYQAGSSSPVSVSWTGTLKPDSTLDYTFATTFTSPVSTYNLCAYTSITGDIYPTNDETCDSIKVSMDAGVISILQPSGITPIGSNVPVKVRAKNFGTTTITSMNIAYQVGTSSPVSVPWTGTLKPDSTLDYTFTTTYVVPDSAHYTLCAYTVLTGDSDPANDKTCKSVQGNLGIKESSSDGLILNQNFPNPANGITTISFNVPSNGEVILSLMNSIGEIVYRESKKVDTGSHTITLNTTPFTAGIYFYEFEFNGNRFYRKMIIN